jgi:nitrite reductase/ring-hydroxylating ferredoxin subunit
MTIYNWHRIDKIFASDLQEGKLTEAFSGDRRIGLLKKGGNIHAFSATCPHAGANLCNGWLDPLGRIVCPEHKYRFDPANGRNTSGEGYKLVIYPVELRGDEIFVGLKDAPSNF